MHYAPVNSPSEVNAISAVGLGLRSVVMGLLKPYSIHVAYLRSLTLGIASISIRIQTSNSTVSFRIKLTASDLRVDTEVFVTNVLKIKAREKQISMDECCTIHSRPHYIYITLFHHHNMVA